MPCIHRRQKPSRILASALLILFAATCQPKPVCADEDHAHDHEHEGHDSQPAAVDDEITYRSTAMPERILLGWKGDPATSQAVTWRTDTSVEHAYAQIALAGEGPHFVRQAKSNQVDATTTLAHTDLGDRHYHAVNFTGLTPNTLYVYRVGDRTNWSAWIHFRTANDHHEPFSFVYYGDAQNDVKSHWSRVFREAFSDAPRAKFMLHAGDLINLTLRDVEWGEWCAAGGWVNGMIPTLAIPGNHEYVRTQIEPKPPKGEEQYTYELYPNWRTRFEFPENGPEDLLETCYYIDYQGVRFIGMNTMDGIQQQTKWLEGVLADNPNRWTIVTHHHPIYSGSIGRDNPEIRNSWQPLYDKYHVDLVLTGHDHTYGRTGQKLHSENLTTGLQTQGEAGGTVYVVSVSGPKQYPRNTFSFARRAEGTQLYQIISIDGDQLTYQAKTATGTLYDGFTLNKREDKTNDMVSQVPDTSEILKSPLLP